MLLWKSTWVCKSAQFHLFNNSRIQKHLTREVTEQLIHAFITSKLDYCNALLYGLPNKQIQWQQRLPSWLPELVATTAFCAGNKTLTRQNKRLQNIAARIVILSKTTPAIWHQFYSLHWLPVSERIKFRALLLVFKCQNNMAPRYLQELIHQYTMRRSLILAPHHLLHAGVFLGKRN